MVDLHPQVGKMGGGNGVKNLKAIQGVTNRGGTPKKHKTPPKKKEVGGGPYGHPHTHHTPTAETPARPQPQTPWDTVMRWGPPKNPPPSPKSFPQNPPPVTSPSWRCRSWGLAGGRSPRSPPQPQQGSSRRPQGAPFWGGSAPAPLLRGPFWGPPPLSPGSERGAGPRERRGA